MGVLWAMGLIGDKTECGVGIPRPNPLSSKKAQSAIAIAVYFLEALRQLGS
jgi:hypothetical protein